MPEAAERAWALIRTLATEGEVFERTAELSREARLSPGLLKALMRLHQQEYPSMREFARQAMGCDPSYVTGLVDELTDRGLAVRQAGVGDRRIKTIVLTPAGEALAERIISTLAVPPASFSSLDGEQLDHLVTLLSVVAEPEHHEVRP